MALLLLCVSITLTLNAQLPGGTPKTVQATVVAGADDGHLCVSVGQPFFQQKSLGGFELSMGVAQA